jgi:hypothetical protein
MSTNPQDGSRPSVVLVPGIGLAPHLLCGTGHVRRVTWGVLVFSPLRRRPSREMGSRYPTSPIAPLTQEREAPDDQPKGG